MRYGLLALSIAMLTGGGVAAQSAYAIAYSATPNGLQDVGLTPNAPTGGLRIAAR